MIWPNRPQWPPMPLVDRMVAQGELMSTRLFTELMQQKGYPAVWFDVRKVMRTSGYVSGKATAIGAAPWPSKRWRTLLAADHFIAHPRLYRLQRRRPDHHPRPWRQRLQCCPARRSAERQRTGDLD